MKNNYYKKFVAFLKENDCYDRFMKKFNDADLDNIGVTLEEFCSKHWRVVDYVSSAFFWDDEFWCDLDDKWLEKIGVNLEEKTIKINE